MTNEYTKGKVYIMYRRYDYREIFQVVTPNATVKLKNKAVVLIKAAEDSRIKSSEP